ncbi:MAG: D-aminoacyl-tRNA deacylase, partial [Promethearchaeota archaeon]
MNIRSRLVNSNAYRFDETEEVWLNHPIFEFKGFSGKTEERLNFNADQIYLGLTKESLIFLNNLNLAKSIINPDLIIFASRHRSEAQRPAFLTHLTGNWSSKAEFGGNPRELSLASALLFKAGFLSLIENSKSKILPNFSTDIEVTHHGPTTLEKPLIFMELGSTMEEWSIHKAGEIVANSIINAIYKYLDLKKKNDQSIALGFGGTHYAPNFHRLVINNNIAMSFICPKYYVQELDRDLITQMIENTLESVDYFIID